MTQEDAIVIENRAFADDYFLLKLRACQLPELVAPGQFVHLELPDARECILRRPFSIYDVVPEKNELCIVYKIVGHGTKVLSECNPSENINLIGPLGRGFTLCDKMQQPVIVAGGYGAAATYLLAQRLPKAPVVLIGGKSKSDLLCVDDFRRLGATVYVVTEDGSEGVQGVVTDLLPGVLDSANKDPAIYACGPMQMLQSVSDIVLNRSLDAEVSLEHRMCCGVGACFACVVKMKSEEEPGWRYARTCREGPVFKASETYWGDT